MGERTPVTTVAELDTLDDDEILEGYLDGFSGEPEPGDNRSKAYWHGWRNGRVDGHHEADPDAAMTKLVQDINRNGGFLRKAGQRG